ncbi:cation:proton antiporter [Verticiella sediminum]|uniref:Cation:proton antiporter n=1 Tax=Verticiella sediminum TaxID=1247510 RepID=A0A556AKN6_9BURK|nr:monovalent cation/H+ antiporter complex subunit F [Verticiella sediminum]TSH93451.1 cation:proton antiporter [Verticiella sediminum]
MIEAWFPYVLGLCAAMLVVAGVCAGIRIVRGPHAADRVVALDMLCVLGVAACGLAALSSGAIAFVDIVLGVALVGFLATAAFAGFIERGARRDDDDEEAS